MNFRQSVIYFGTIGATTAILVTGLTVYGKRGSQPQSPPPAAPQPVPTPIAAPKATGTKPAATKIAWQSSYEAALKAARKQGKPIMMDFYTDWCGWCKKLDKDVFPKPVVVAEAANFISVRINAEKRSDLASKYHVTGFPTILWLRADGSVIDRLPGYAEPDELAQMLRSVAANAGGEAA